MGVHAANGTLAEDRRWWDKFPSRRLLQPGYFRWYDVNKALLPQPEQQGRVDALIGSPSAAVIPAVAEIIASAFRHYGAGGQSTVSPPLVGNARYYGAGGECSPTLRKRINVSAY